jgi:hypothetical protein
MATRYWVGGTGTWDPSSTTNWATTSGGSGGASAPTSSDDVIFDANSGTGSAVVTCNGGNCAGFTYDSAALVTLSGYINVYGTFFLNRAATTALSTLQVVMFGSSISMAVNSYVQELDIIPSVSPYKTTAFGNIYAKYLNVSNLYTLDLNGNFAKTNRLNNYNGIISNGSIYFSAVNSSYHYVYSDGVWSGVTLYIETGTYPATVQITQSTGANVGDVVVNATSQVGIYSTLQAKNITINSGATVEPDTIFGSSGVSIYAYGNFYLASGATLKSGSGTVYCYVYINKVSGSPTVTRTLRVDGTLLDPSAVGMTFFINSGTDTVNVPGSGFGSSAHYPKGGISVQSTANFSCSAIYAGGISIYPSVACDISALSSINVTNFQNRSIGLVPGSCAINIYNYAGLGQGLIQSSAITLAAVTIVDAIPVRIYDSTTFGNLTCASSLGQGSTKGLEFEPGSTQTVTGNFVLSGASASDRVNLTIRGSGAAATITKASGTVTASYANISYSNATGGAVFKAPLTTNIDGGNNTGWIFGIPGGGNFFSFF